MSEHDHKKETRRLCNLLRKMADLAEHVEQTGSFESGVQNSVKRYNAIVERLEEIDAVPEDMFPKLDDKSDSGQLGSEAALLADYLKDMLDEEAGPHPAPPKPPDFNSLVALAPFLGSTELSQLIREHLPGAKSRKEREPEVRGAFSEPDIESIMELAPHMKSEDVGQMVRAYLSRHGRIDPKALVSLAPHMKAEELGQIVHANMPEWFGAPAPPRPEEPPDVPKAYEENREDWGDR